VTIQHLIRPINPTRRSAAVTEGEDEARLQPAVQRRSDEESVSLSRSLLVPSLSTSDFVLLGFYLLKSQILSLLCSSCEASDSEKGCTSSKDPKSSSSSSSRKHQGKEAAAKAQNGGERKCEVAVAHMIIISTETSNGRAVKERSRKKKTGGGPTFTSLLTARSKEAAAIGGVARKREDLIIVNIDEASGDNELAVAEYAVNIYKFYELTEGESQVCDYMGKQPDIDERLRSIL
ncbi:hypothetical protein Dimus_010988, partial [Dionaea muscipula]